MPNKITVYEHSCLYRDKGKYRLGDDVYKALVGFYGDEKKNTCPYYTLIKDGIRFNQYVGVLCVGKQVIEVLPKADKGAADDSDENKWRNCLLHMLRRVYKLEVKSPSQAPQKLTSSAILDIFINRFLNEVDVLLNRGLVKCYHREEGNLFAMKGKMLWNKQLSRNCVHKERFYVNYTTYDREHVMNRILRKTLEVIPKIAENPSLRGRAVSTLFNFPELKEIEVTEQTFASLVFDRKTEDYRQAIEIAKLILLHYMPNSQSGKTDILALMFDMNKLWEEYIYRVLRRGLNGYEVSAQVIKTLWKSDNANKRIQADICVKDKKDDDKLYILDTKWKVPEKMTPSDDDLHQMYVYAKRFKAAIVALLYPKTNDIEVIKGDFCEEGIPCDMLFLPCCQGEGKSWQDWEKEICKKITNEIHTRFVSVSP